MALVVLIQHLEPSFPDGDDLFGIGGPSERLCLIAVVLINEAVDCRLTYGDGVEDRMLQTPPCKLREEPLHRVQPGGPGIFRLEGTNMPTRNFALTRDNWSNCYYENSE